MPVGCNLGLNFTVASATDIALEDGSLARILGWWSLFNLPRGVLPNVLRSYEKALLPGGRFLMGTHVGDGDVVRSEACGGVPVTWTTYLWQPEQLTALITDTGFQVDALLTMPPAPPGRPQVLISAQKPA